MGKSRGIPNPGRSGRSIMLCTNKDKSRFLKKRCGMLKCRSLSYRDVWNCVVDLHIS